MRRPAHYLSFCICLALSTTSTGIHAVTVSLLRQGPPTLFFFFPLSFLFCLFFFFFPFIFISSFYPFPIRVWDVTGRVLTCNADVARIHTSPRTSIPSVLA
jgi:hypothetical protein